MQMHLHIKINQAVHLRGVSSQCVSCRSSGQSTPKYVMTCRILLAKVERVKGVSQMGMPLRVKALDKSMAARATQANGFGVFCLTNSKNEFHRQ